MLGVRIGVAHGQTRVSIANMMITYGEIKNGMVVSVVGHAMRVSDVTHTPTPACSHTGATWHRAETCQGCQNIGRIVVRFTGRVVDPTDSVRGTTYDGGRYGGWADVPVYQIVGTSAASR